MTEPIRVVIVDDNVQFRDSIRLLLGSSEGFAFVAGFDNGDGIQNMLKHMDPTVILMDVDMPVMNGIECVKKIRAINQTIPIMMLTSFEDDDKVFASICAGANGYILKNTRADELLKAIKEICSGGAPMTPSVARKVLQMFRQENAGKPAPPDVDLSRREREVLELLVEGKSYKMIASELFISFETVHSHIKRIYKALEVHSATEAVAKSLRDRIV